MVMRSKQRIREQIERSLNRYNEQICENCMDTTNCKWCEKIDTRSAQDIIDDEGDRKYHEKSEGGI